MIRDGETDDVGAEPAEHPLELALRHGLRYSGLRDVQLDARLLLYVPLDVCERETVLPLTVTEEVLQVATAYPDPDLDLVAGRFPALAIELVLAPMERIAELLDDLRAAL
jgi:hypothetical protein